VAEVVWSPRAQRDIASIGAYHAESAPGYAALLLRRLVAVVERLEAFPRSGRVVPEIGDENLREVLHRNYRIVYLHLPEQDRVEVITVFHASRQFGAPPGGAENP
jgi:toxin ParE1/3/4